MSIGAPTADVARPFAAPAVAAPRVRRTPFLSISLTDLLFFAIIFWLFAGNGAAGWDRLLWDGDVALHTRIGDYVLDHGQVPTQDVFSFTKPGERFYALQWLTGVLFALLNRWTGLKGIVLLAAILIALYQIVLVRDMVRRGVNGLFAIVLTLMGGNAAMIHFHARPHLFTLLLLACAGYLIARDRERQSWVFWLIVPMTALWANLHSGFPVVLVLLTLLSTGCALSAIVDKASWAPARRYAIAASLCGIASLLNPNGVQLHLHILHVLGDSWMTKYISEYQSPVFSSEPMLYFMALLFAALFFAYTFFRKHQWTECLWIGFFAYSSLISARHIPLFVIVTLPLIGIAASQLWNEKTSSASRTSILGVIADLANQTSARLKPLSVWGALAVCAIVFFTSAQVWPRDLSAKYFPLKMVRSHAQELASSRVFTSDQWGDYLLWVNYPRQRVFIDGRSDFFGESVGREYMKLGDASAGWRDVLKKYDVNEVLIPPGIPLVELLGKEPGWRLVAQDKESVLFRK